MTPVEPKPAASVVLVRSAPPEAAEPIEVYMIRRNKGMRFLGGFYAFPGGKVDPADAMAETLACCRGLTPSEAEALLSDHRDVPPLAFWVTGVRELLEETGVLLACDADGRTIDGREPSVAEGIDAARRALMEGRPLGEALAGRGWYCDLRPLRYLTHFVTPTSSPIRFNAAFFLCPVPGGQTPRLFTEETSEALWVTPAVAYARFRAGEMAMAEPAEYGLAYLAQFDSLADLVAAHDDRRHKFQGIIDRIDFYAGYDWSKGRFRASGRASPGER